MSGLAAQLLNGVQYGLLLFLISSGLTLIFGVMGVINLAHGSLFMIGAYIAFIVAGGTGSLWLALPVAVLGGLAFGALLERGLFRRFYHREHLDQVLLTFALILLFEEGRSMLLGNDFHSTALVLAMFALSLQLLVGVTGLVSLGHAAFFGVGAYAIHLLGAFGTAPSVLLSLPAAMLLAALAAFAVGALALRTRGFFFLMTTLAFGQMLFFVFHDTPLGGGADGVFVTRPSFSLFGLEWVVSRQDRPTVMLLLNLGVLVAMYAGLALLLRTMFGRALLGIRANEHRMRSMGFDTYWLQLAAFTVAGAMAGVAGHMWGMTQAFVSPELLAWHRSAEALLMILLGGLGALHGPILGAFAFVGLGEIAGQITERQRLVEGLVILAVVLGLRHGIAGIRLPALRRLPTPAPAAKEAAP